MMNPLYVRANTIAEPVFDYAGKRLTIREHAARHGAPFALVNARMERGWPIAKAIERDWVHHGATQFNMSAGELQTAYRSPWSPAEIRYRLLCGMTPAEALAPPVRKVKKK
jgi:hypothetical protein